MPAPRAHAAARFALALDGLACGFLRSVAGGAITADVITVAAPGPFDQKRLAGVRYEALELQLDLSLDKLVYDWIAASWKGTFSRRDGSIVGTDLSGNPVSEQEFFHGLVTEVTIPALDAAAKDPGFLTVKIAPEYTRSKKGTGAAITTAGFKQKPWLPSNFKLEIDRLDAKRVSKVDALTVKQSVARDPVGEKRAPIKEPTKVEFPNLRVTLAAADAGTWTAWFDDFVVKGNNDPTKERNGTLTLLSADVKAPLGAVSFFNLGIFRIEPEAQQAGAETVARVVASLYCERMELAIPAVA